MHVLFFISFFVCLNSRHIKFIIMYTHIFKKIQDYVNEAHANGRYYNVQYKQTEVNVTEGSGKRYIITGVLKGQIRLFSLVSKGNQVGATAQTNGWRCGRV